MKIAHLIPQFYPYFAGAEICVHNVSRMLSDNGHTSIVICTTPPADKKPVLNYDIIHLFPKTCGLLGRMPFIGKYYLEYELSRLQRKHKFDLWQVTMGYPLGIYAVDFFKKNKIPCVLVCGGEDIQKYPEIGYGYRLNDKIDSLVKNKYPLFDAFVAYTLDVKKEYENIGVPAEKIRIIPIGVDTAKFARIKSSIDRIAVKRKYGFSGDSPLLLTVGRYHPKKGFDQIPEIAEKLDRGNIKYEWAIVGKGCDKLNEKIPSQSKSRIKTIEKFARSGGVSFSLPADSLIELYCAADIFVFPTLIETFGMVLVESMAAGLPIITTNAIGVRDVIRHEENGLAVPVNDPNAVAEAIGLVLKDKSLSANLSSIALKEAAETYDWRTVTEKYSELYRCLLAAKK